LAGFENEDEDDDEEDSILLNFRQALRRNGD
jgi:hypothetical protein